MNRFKVVAMIFCLGLMTLAFSASVKADEWNKETVVTFSEPFEIPGGKVLPSGTYVFRLMDSSSDRNIVQIFSEDKRHLIATILAISNYRFRATDKTVMTFGERAAGSPEAIRAWFYPGNNYGQEFVYPKKRAMELAKLTNVPVLAMATELELNITAPAASMDEPPIVALKEAPLVAVRPTGEEVEIAEVVERPPVQVATARHHRHIKRLPQTASHLPLLALVGMLSLGGAFGLLALSRRRKA
jgi:LPXTG-motif cell wall-anchored protein